MHFFKAEECFLIGSFAYEKNDTYNAYSWHKIGYERLNDNRKDFVKFMEELIDVALKVVLELYSFYLIEFFK